MDGGMRSCEYSQPISKLMQKKTGGQDSTGTSSELPLTTAVPRPGQVITSTLPTASALLQVSTTGPSILGTRAPLQPYQPALAPQSRIRHGHGQTGAARHQPRDTLSMGVVKSQGEWC